MANNTENVTISVKTSTVIKIFALIVVSVLFLNLVKEMIGPILLIAISFFLALGLNPTVSKISAKLKSHSRVRATGIAYVMVLTILIGFFALLIPPLVAQTIKFVQDVPATVRDFKTQDSPASRFVHRYNLDDPLENFASDFGSHFSDVSKPALDTATTIGSTIANTIIILVLTFMMLVEGPRWLDKFWAMQTETKRKKRKEIAHKMYRVVTGYVNGQLLVAVIGGMFTFITLMIASEIFDVSVNAIALAAIVSLFALLPMIGTTIGAIIVVTACIFVSIPLAIVMGVFFVVYQQIENVTLQPYIQSRSNNLTPLIVFSAAMIGVSIAGLVGALFAVPVAGCIGILVEDYYKRRVEKLNS